MVPVPRGTSEEPFGPLPEADQPGAVVTPSGVVTPVEAVWDEGYLVRTPCRTVRLISEATPLDRAHVVLDPGHGGREVGAAGAELTEKELNLEVALRAQTMLETLGATVVLTRDFDHTLTTATRGQIAAQLAPALFISIHHNGGAPPSSDRPGTIVFTKTGDPEATRFGGLFYGSLVPRLNETYAQKVEARRAYVEALDAHEAAVAAYDTALAARDAALVTNEQVQPTATTAPPAPPADVDGMRVPSTRDPVTTTTVVGNPTVGVPELPPLPEPFELEPVPTFLWAGGGNSGVRSWTRDDGQDFLSVLRTSGEVTSVLAEFLYLTNAVEEELLKDPEFLDLEAAALVEAVVNWFTTDASGTGFVQDQFGDQNIGGGGRRADCNEPNLL